MQRLYISFDFEGIGGVTNWRETINNKRFNELATDQLLEFINGLKSVNRNIEVYISDSHAYGENLIWEKFPENVYLIKGYPRNYYMMEGIDESFDGVVFFGYHSMIGINSYMDHTYSSSSIYEIKINGKPVDEATINAYFAGEFNVPVKMIYTDKGTYENLKNIFPEKDVLYTISKEKAISRFAGTMKSYKLVLKELFNAGKKIFNIKGYTLKVDYPVKAEIKLIDSLRAYMSSIIPGVKLIDDRTLKFETDNFINFYRYLITILYVCASAKIIK